MRGGDGGLPVADRAGVDDDHRRAVPGEQIRRRQTGDAGADDTDISGRVAREGRRGGTMSGIDP
jgi:hypothetical protein